MMETSPTLFAKLAWVIYFNSSPSQSSQEYSTFADSISSLVNTTKITSYPLIHVHYYLYLLVNHKSSLPFLQNGSTSTPFHSSSREKLISGPKRKSSTELYQLLVVLLMISNKAHNDSSYTINTWEDLSNMSIQTLKKREIIVLKKINYNVFLKGEQYDIWCKYLYSLALKFNIEKDSWSVPSSPQLIYQPPVLQPIQQRQQQQSHQQPQPHQSQPQPQLQQQLPQQVLYRHRLPSQTVQQVQPKPVQQPKPAQPQVQPQAQFIQAQPLHPVQPLQLPHCLNPYPLTPKSPILDMNSSLNSTPINTQPQSRSCSKRIYDPSNDLSPCNGYLNPLKKYKYTTQTISPALAPPYSYSNSLSQSYLLTPIKSLRSNYQQSSYTKPQSQHLQHPLQQQHQNQQQNQQQHGTPFKSDYTEASIIRPYRHQLNNFIDSQNQRISENSQSYQQSQFNPNPDLFNKYSILPPQSQPQQQQSQSQSHHNQQLHHLHHNHQQPEIHSDNCGCCKLTNRTNSYFSSIRNTMVKL